MDANVDACAAYIRRQWPVAPRIGVILGTGLGSAVGQVEVQRVIPYETVPHFPRSTALSHQGQLVCGLLRGVPTIVMSGRCHLYEGYTFDEVTLPVRVMRALGARLLMVSNASGGLNPRFQGGDLMVIADHVNFMFGSGHPQVMSQREQGRGTTTLAERGFVSRGPATPSRHGSACGWCYDSGLIDQALRIARRGDFVAHRGVYVAVSGPNFETRAEYRLFRRLGGDAVGMSTVPEALTAAQLGMRVLALSMITNVALPDAPRKTEAHEVVALAAQAEPHLSQIVLGIAESERA
jgi:purine-nucleoside phosphorylase